MRLYKAHPPISPRVLRDSAEYSGWEEIFRGETEFRCEIQREVDVQSHDKKTKGQPFTRELKSYVPIALHQRRGLDPRWWRWSKSTYLEVFLLNNRSLQSMYSSRAGPRCNLHRSFRGKSNDLSAWINNLLSFHVFDIAINIAYDNDKAFYIRYDIIYFMVGRTLSCGHPSIILTAHRHYCHRPIDDTGWVWVRTCNWTTLFFGEFYRYCPLPQPRTHSTLTLRPSFSKTSAESWAHLLLSSPRFRSRHTGLLGISRRRIVERDKPEKWRMSIVHDDDLVMTWVDLAMGGGFMR